MTRATTNEADPPMAKRRVLDPVDRDSEFLYGLIMALAFTCTLSVATAGDGKVRTAMLGALACNAASGIVDAVLYLLSCLAQRERSLLTLRTLRAADSTDVVRPILEEALPPSVIAVLDPRELDELRARIARLPPPGARAALSYRDYLAALVVFAVVMLATVPVILPLALFQDSSVGLRVSNAVAVGLLFVFGRSVGRAIGAPPARTGVAMVLIGAVLVAITILLGG